MVSEPGGQFGFWQVTRGKGENQVHHFWFLCLNWESVEAEEHVHGLEGQALVPVQEGVVLSEPNTIGCCEIKDIGLGLLMETISGSVQLRVEKTLISQSKGSAMLSNLAPMDSSDHVGIEPPRLLHLASSRMALRYCLAPSS